MNKKLNFITKYHLSTKRDYKKRMFEDKIQSMIIARKFEKDFWDGKRKYGYGGYKYIPGLLEPLAKKIIKYYKLTNSSKILEIGCGKGYLLYEIYKILPKIKIVGFDISKYAIKNSKKEIKKNYQFVEQKKLILIKINYLILLFV